MKLSTFKANRLLVIIFTVLFSKRTWKIAFVIISLGSMLVTGKLLQDKYNFTCAQGGGYFMTDQVCHDYSEAAFYTAEYYRLSETYENNIKYSIE